MSKQVQRRRGTTAEHAAFTGAVAEVTVDTTKKTLVVHDGATPGGTPMARESHNHDGTYVTPSGTETLTNKTLTGYKETGYNLTGTSIDPANGTLQYKTLSGNTTFTEALADGQSVTLMLNPATYTVTWPTMTWIGTTASAAPTLIASVYNCIVLFQLAGTLYGKYVGRV